MLLVENEDLEGEHVQFVVVREGPSCSTARLPWDER